MDVNVDTLNYIEIKMKSVEASKTRTNVSFPGVFLMDEAALKESPGFLLTPPLMSGRNSGGEVELSLKASGAPVFSLMGGGECGVLVSSLI